MSKLYDVLLHLHNSQGEASATAQHCIDYDFTFCGIKLKFKHLPALSDNLFKHLNVKFHQFFSALRDVSESKSRRVAESHPNLWNVVKYLNSVLRSCLIILTLLDAEQKSLLEKCRYIRQILKIFVSVDMGERNKRTLITFENLVSGDCIHTNVEDTTTSVSLELSDPCRPFLCAVLEVFADEFLKHPSLRKHLMIVESSSSITENVFLCHNHGCVASILEVISAHFVLSVSNEQALENFISTLLLHCGKESRDPELSLEASISLLLNPILLSAPKILQAHVISIVSEVFCDGLSSKNLVPDNVMDCNLTAFERSVILYSMHVSSLQMDGSYIGFKCSNNSYLLGRSQATFENCVQKVTRNKLNHVMSKLDNSWDSYQRKMSSKTKADLLTEYVTFMKESQHIYAGSCRDMIVPIGDCILRTLSGNAASDVLNTKENTRAQDIFLLASILKLMSISLVQAIRCLSNGGDLGCQKRLGNSSLCQRYDFLISTINCFQQFNIGLLSFSFIHGFDILAKACISVIMALMYLFIFEEGDLTALGSLRDLPLQSLSLDKAGGGDGNRTSYKVASEFLKIRECLSRNSSSSFQQGIQDKQAGNLSTVNILNYCSSSDSEETCNGKIFLDCILGGSKRSSDYADLADFIECKKRKDYHRWLKDREKYRGWRQEKVANLRKKKKWKSLKCRKMCVAREKMKITVSKPLKRPKR
ncbi:uncharacterized protein G2W53_027890 [Senna tora]|uniref:DUF7812 domain-containing protein n=1 Tax=Senna tora TaxID=362788 RepID=A0A834TIK5_9FABA|nr:uncharacterized protein G2W53_027890 [Senna tora]